MFKKLRNQELQNILELKVSAGFISLSVNIHFLDPSVRGGGTFLSSKQPEQRVLNVINIKKKSSCLSVNW